MNNVSQPKIVYSSNYGFAKPRSRHNAHMGFFQIIDKELVYLQSSFSDEFHKNRTKEMGLYDKKVPEKQVLFDYTTFGYLKSAGSLYL